MGEEDSYRETFALWAGNVQLTKLSGSDHFGALRIGGKVQVNLQLMGYDEPSTLTKSLTC